jgi:hypothetical protein
MHRLRQSLLYPTWMTSEDTDSIPELFVSVKDIDHSDLSAD